VGWADHYSRALYPPTGNKKLPAEDEVTRVGLPRLSGHAFRDLAIYMSGFGLLVGVVFPFAVIVLGVPADIALRPLFQAACIVAGLLVGAVNFALARLAVGVRLARLVAGMDEAAVRLRAAAETGDVTAQPIAAVAVDSADEFGRAAGAYNDLLLAVERARRVESAIAVLTAATTGSLDGTALAGRALDAACLHPEITGGVVGDPDGPWAHRGLTDHQVATVLGTELPPGRLLVRPEPAGGVLAVLALVDLGETIGTLGLTLTVPPDAAVERMLHVLAEHLGVALANARLHRQMTELATIDHLTGIDNRRSAMARLDQEIAGALRSGRPLGVILLDLDHFKSVNDTYGHSTGDRVLVQVTRLCRNALRPTDLLARYGGEELIAILPDADVEGVTVIAERLRRSVAESPVHRPDGDPIGMTLTAGAICWRPHTALDADALLGAADLALYAGKAEGRNRCVVRVLSGPNRAEC
jgi:diguanylate cyclase (GGDEF)-like protein